MIEVVDSNGRSALHHACAAGLPDAVIAYLSAGCSIDLKDVNGKVPLDLTESEDVRRAVRSFISERSVGEWRGDKASGRQARRI